ncbi:unnamed protein product [Moneuplotes crassus]|uniref:Major facilitator superfamily (MFS) profile domain-containing protein n=1 Tax=Euplotes crassus TaxID=5936 RepID=A0AAD1UBU3_EUPCR|nr:unnamed protein product [Moneuplotes crassus]
METNSFSGAIQETQIAQDEQSINAKSERSSTSSMKTDSEISKSQFKLYPIRWVICVFFTTSIVASGLGMVGMTAITPIISDIYDVSGLVTNMLVLPFIILFIPLIFPANYLIENYGISIPVYWATVTLLVGAWVRLFVNYNFFAVIGGQVIMALGQPFVLSAPAKLSALWFGDKEMAISTTLGSLAAPIGAVLGFLLPLPLIGEKDAPPNNTPEHGQRIFFRYILIQNIIITVLGLPIIFFIRNHPPTPPSANAAKALKKRPANQCRSCGVLFKNVDFIMLLVSFSFIYSIYITLGAAVGQLSFQFNFPPSANSIFGTAYIFGGLFGSFGHAILLDKYQKYKLQYLFIGFACILTMGAVIATMSVGSQPLTASLLFFLGVAQLPSIGVAYSFCCELTYPVNEALSCGILMLFGSIFASGLTFAVGNLLDIGHKYPAVFLMLGFVVLGTIAQFFVREILRRKRAGLKSGSFSFSVGNHAQTQMSTEIENTSKDTMSNDRFERPMIEKNS